MHLHLNMPLLQFPLDMVKVVGVELELFVRLGDVCHGRLILVVFIFLAAVLRRRGVLLSLIHTGGHPDYQAGLALYHKGGKGGRKKQDGRKGVNL